VQSLDSVRLLTRGEPFNLRNVMRRVSPTVFQDALIWEVDESRTTFGQIEKSESFNFAQMSYMGGFDYPDNSVIALILEELSGFAQEWGALGVLADLPEHSPLFEGFRLAGFTIWARQSIYIFAKIPVEDKQASSTWREYQSTDKHSLSRLNKKQIPAFSQPMVPLSRKSEMRLVAMSPKNECVGYADISVGPKGVWVQPLFDCHANNADLLTGLSAAIPNPAARPIYLCTRSYQPQLGNFAESVGYEKVGSQVLMVKQLVLREQVDQREIKSLFEKGSIEGSVPLTQSKNKPN